MRIYPLYCSILSSPTLSLFHTKTIFILGHKRPPKPRRFDLKNVKRGLNQKSTQLWYSRSALDDNVSAVVARRWAWWARNSGRSGSQSDWYSCVVVSVATLEFVWVNDENGPRLVVRRRAWSELEVLLPLRVTELDSDGWTELCYLLNGFGSWMGAMIENTKVETEVTNRERKHTKSLGPLTEK